MISILIFPRFPQFPPFFLHSQLVKLFFLSQSVAFHCNMEKKPSLFPASKLPRLNFFNIFLHFNFELLSPAATRFLQTSFNNFTANGFAKVHDDSLRFAIEKTRGANSRMKAIYSLAKRGSLAVEPYQLAEFRMSV